MYMYECMCVKLLENYDLEITCYKTLKEYLSKFWSGKRPKEKTFD